MSIKLLAVELYRARQNVERISAQIEAAEAAPLNAPAAEREVLADELREAQAELRQLRKMLDDKKASSSPPVPGRVRNR